MSRPLEAVLASSSAKKLAELHDLLGPVVVLHPLPDGVILPEETGATFEDNALLKARAFASTGGVTALADDSGLEVDALGGRPGIASARYAATDPARISRLLEELASVPVPRRTARFRCVLALVGPGIEMTAEGTCEGSILTEPRGSSGFGYDPVFVPAGESLSFGEMTSAGKARYSHRARAGRALLERLTAHRG